MPTRPDATPADQCVETTNRWPAPVAVEAVRCRKPPIIDGRLDEPDWQRAPAMPIHYPVNHVTPMREGPGATARLLWDEQNLYAGFEVQTHGVVAPLLERDGPVYEYDCIELFLSPRPRSGRYWEFNVSPSGSVFDVLFPRSSAQAGDRPAPPHCPGLQYACRVEPQGRSAIDDEGVTAYTIEMAIPLRELPDWEPGAVEGRTIYGHLALARQGRPEHPHAFLSHTPMLNTFHDTSLFAPLKLVEGPR